MFVFLAQAFSVFPVGDVIPGHVGVFRQMVVVQMVEFE